MIEPLQIRCRIVPDFKNISPETVRQGGTRFDPMAISAKWVPVSGLETATIQDLRNAFNKSGLLKVL